MPELPEVETVRRGLASALEGRRLIRVLCRRSDLRFPLPPEFEPQLTGRRVEKVRRRAKFLLLELEGGLVMISHLGMSGRFRVFTRESPPLEPHDHIVFETDEGVSLRFHDPRRFGFIDLISADNVDRHPMLVKLGPEPLAQNFTAHYLTQQLRHRRTPIKSAILDQRVVAGMGNIYACESLFRAGLSPKRAANTVTGIRAHRLVGAIQDILREAIAVGGSSLRDHRQTSGEFGYFQRSLAVYGHAGEACPGCDCDISAQGGIRRIVQAGRSTFYCSKRQR